MLVFKGLEPPASSRRPSAVAIGNFDGFHLGHREIISRLKEEAAKDGLERVVLTFDPHPERALGKRSVRMIDTMEQRLESLEAAGVDRAVIIPFDSAFSGLSPADFVSEVLAAGLATRVAVVGENFRFGKDRRGTIDGLARLGLKHSIRVCPVAPLVLSGRTVSSSLIRGLLEKGRVEEAALFLGRPYEIRGRVVRGIAKGRQLGFPTANLDAANEITPEGVFVSEAVLGGETFPSVTVIGVAPSVSPRRSGRLVETHIFDFDRELWGSELAVRLLRKVRPVRRFRSEAALVDRIGLDIAEAKRYFMQGAARGRRDA
jgi:riboflavin kinase/FMN adenylyltransferase